MDCPVQVFCAFVCLFSILRISIDFCECFIYKNINIIHHFVSYVPLNFINEFLNYFLVFFFFFD